MVLPSSRFNPLCLRVFFSRLRTGLDHWHQGAGQEVTMAFRTTPRMVE
jgi:hypothetical protein